jgi:hypothetical protein
MFLTELLNPRKVRPAGHVSRADSNAPALHRASPRPCRERCPELPTTEFDPGGPNLGCGSIGAAPAPDLRYKHVTA